MKFLLLFLVISLSTCKTKEVSLINNLSVNSKAIKVNECPEGITCTIEVFKNKTYTIETDSMNKIYPKIIDGEDIVVKYTYSVDNPNNYADGNQSETLHFIISENMKSTFTDKGLQDIKLTFGKNCFCRDIFGFYRVEKGNFTVTTNKKTSTVNIEFSIPKLGKRQFMHTVRFNID